MNKNILLGIIGVLTLGLAYLLFVRRSGTSTSNAIVANPAQTVGGLQCLTVPTTFQAYNGESMNSGMKAFLGVSDADWTPAFQQRVLGFWKAVNAQPTDARAAYFGKEAILAYLASDSGKLPASDVMQGGYRCQSIAGNSLRIS
jgi:hypothetical protein